MTVFLLHIPRVSCLTHFSLTTTPAQNGSHSLSILISFTHFKISQLASQCELWWVDRWLCSREDGVLWGALPLPHTSHCLTLQNLVSCRPHHYDSLLIGLSQSLLSNPLSTLLLDLVCLFFLKHNEELKIWFMPYKGKKSQLFQESFSIK